MLVCTWCGDAATWSRLLDDWVCASCRSSDTLETENTVSEPIDIAALRQKIACALYDLDCGGSLSETAMYEFLADLSNALSELQATHEACVDAEAALDVAMDERHHWEAKYTDMMAAIEQPLAAYHPLYPERG